MKNLYFVCGLILAGSILLAGCMTTPQTKPAAPQPEPKDLCIAAISVVIHKELDREEIGKEFLLRLCEGEIDIIAEKLLTGGISCDVNAFKDEYNKSPHISFEEVDLRQLGVIHHYTWKTRTQTIPGHNIILNFILMDDGQIDMKCLIK